MLEKGMSQKASFGDAPKRRESLCNSTAGAKNLSISAYLLAMRPFILLSLGMLLLCSTFAVGQTNNSTGISPTAPSNMSIGTSVCLNATTLEDPIASALRSLVLDSSATPESYSFHMEMSQDVDILNLSSGEAQSIHTQSLGFGSLNMTARALKLIMASLAVPRIDNENATALAMEEYLVNDTIYLKTDGNWTSMKIPGMETVWYQQDAMQQQIDMLNQSSITLQGVETVDGEECYKLMAEIDASALANQLYGQNYPFLSAIPMNYSELFGNMTLKSYYWIARDTHILKKTDVRESYVVSPQSLGIPVKGPKSQEMRVNASFTLTFEGFNESVNVVLPAEAKGAKPLSLALTEPEQQVPVSPVTNTSTAAAKAAKDVPVA